MKKFFYKKGKRIAALILAGAMTASLFTACGKSTDKDESGKTVISVGGWPEKNDNTYANYEKMRTEFEQENPDVSVVPDQWTFDLKSFYPKAAGGQLPNVYESHFTEVSQIINANYGSDITAALKKYNLYDNLNKNVLDVVSKDGKVYAFPYAAYVLGLAYNVDLFQKAGLMNDDGTPKQPKNWNEVAEFAQKIKQATGKAGFVFPTANNNGGWIFTCLAWSFGTEFMKQDGDGKWKATFNSPEAAAALQWIKDLKWKYDVLPSNALIDGTELYKVFGTGEAAMLIAAGDFPRDVVSYDMKPEQAGIMAIPSGPKKHVTLLGGSVYALSNNSTEDQIDAGVRWIKQSYTPIISDTFKENKKKEIESYRDKGQLVTIQSMSPWNSNAETVKYESELRTSMANANINHVRLYNEFVTNLGDCELRPEEPICTQELYGILDGCIQEVLTNKDADCAALLEKANSDFQSNYLDNIDY